MSDTFIHLLNISISASFLCFAILIYRVIFKKAPKYISVLLWGLLALRLALPFEIESALSLVPSKETVPEDIVTETYPAIESGIPIVDEIINPALGSSMQATPEYSINPIGVVLEVLGVIWLIGTLLMLGYLALSYAILAIRLRESVKIDEGVYASDYAAAPFIFGIIKPKIYLPSGTAGEDNRHIIAHERAHIARLDHIWKPLFFIILSVYWFNPVIWAAYFVLSKDIELACDEKVTRELDVEGRAQYSEALLGASLSHRMVRACPLAFGEVGVKARIKAIASYTKPAAVLVVCSLVIALLFSLCFLTYPEASTAQIHPGIYYPRLAAYIKDKESYTHEDEMPMLIFFEDGMLYAEGTDVTEGSYTPVGKLSECYLSRRDYARLFGDEGEARGSFAMEYLRRYNARVFKARQSGSGYNLPSGEIYVFLEDTGDIYIGFSSGGEMDALYQLHLSELLPKHYQIATYKNGSDIISSAEIALNTADNTMSISFGALSSYRATGSYYTDKGKLIFTTNDSFALKFVFEIKKNALRFIREESDFGEFEFAGFSGGELFERSNYIYEGAGSVFYDVGGDGRFEVLTASKSEADDGCVLKFHIFARGENYPTLSLPFGKYDYITLDTAEDGGLILICENKDIELTREIWSLYISYEEVRAELREK